MKLSISNGYRGLGLIIVLLFVFALGASTLLAQVDTGSIGGTVTDQSGAVIPNAKVTLIDEATKFARTKDTGADGIYQFTPLKVGIYTVTVEVAGFQRAERTHVTLDIQQHATADFAMVPGRVTQTVEVKSTAATLQTQQASVQQVIGSRDINDLPLNGRNSTFLAQLSAGVSNSQSDGRLLAANGGFVANGVHADQNNYMLDGIDNNSAVGDLVNETYYVVLPPPDALQEFSVQTNNYSAEFGHSAGAVLNAVTKSGTNQFHGDLWEYVRNDKLDSADFFLDAARLPKGEYRQNQFGATFGGPLGRSGSGNKTFFFGDYQGTRIRQGNPYTDTIPTAAERASGFTNFQDLITGQQGTPRTDNLGRTIPVGTILDPATTRNVTSGAMDPVTGLTATATGQVRDPFYTGSITGLTTFNTAALNILPVGRLDSNAIKLLNLFPNPTIAAVANNFTTAPVISTEANTFDVRIDRNFSEKDTMFARYSLAKTNLVYPGPFPGVADGAASRPGSGPTKAQDWALSETHTFSSTLINEARIGYSRLHDIRLQYDGNVMGIPAQYGIQGIPQIDQNGGLPYLIIGSYNLLGSAQTNPSNKWSNTIQATENLTKLKGNHTIRAGFEFQDIRFPMLTPPTSRGAFTFNGEFTSVVNKTDGSTGVAQFLLSPEAATVAGGINNVGGANQVAASNFRTMAEMRRLYIAGYVQDNWKVTSKFTINMGVRYESEGRPHEYFGAEASLWNPGPHTGTYVLPTSRNSLVPTAFTNMLATDGITYAPTNGPVWEFMSYGDIGPRMGLAYHVRHDLVVRAGYALFYGGLENEGLSARSTNAFPFIVSTSYSAANSVTPISASSPGVGTLEQGLLNVPLSATSVSSFERAIALIGSAPQWKDPAVQNWNMTIEEQLSPSTTFTMAYVGSTTRHLHDDAMSMNTYAQILPPGTNAFTYAFYPDFATGGTMNISNGDANYNALEANAQRHFAGGLSILGNYTYSKCRTDTRDILNNDIGGYRAPYIDGFGIQQDYSLCDYDIRNIVHFSGTYLLPVGNGMHFMNRGGVGNAILGGWSMNWALTLQDGKPETIGCPTAATTGLGCNALLVPGTAIDSGLHNVNQWMNIAAFANPAPATSIGQSNLAPLGGAPTQVVGPGFHRLDFSLFKQFKVTESKTLEFRGEFFNITNHPDFATPSGTSIAVSSTFGKITSTVNSPNDPRQIQLALKFYF
ncbi:MAG: TonB-dependent receptor [Terriglobia bacterium]